MEDRRQIPGTVRRRRFVPSDAQSPYETFCCEFSITIPHVSLEIKKADAGDPNSAVPGVGLLIAESTVMVDSSTESAEFMIPKYAADGTATKTRLSETAVNLNPQVVWAKGLPTSPLPPRRSIALLTR
jgi:hypothetical protein